MIELPIFKCEAIKTPSGLWVLSKVKNDIGLFIKHEIFDGDYLHDNLYDSDLIGIKENWDCIEFELRAVGDGDVDIHNIKQKTAWFYPSKNEFPPVGVLILAQEKEDNDTHNLHPVVTKHYQGEESLFKKEVKAWTYLPSM